MKKIGILVYDYTLVGGAEKVAKNLAEEFAKKNDVTVISVFGSSDRMNTNGYTYKRLFDKNMSLTLNLFKIVKELRNYLVKNEIEILFLITAGVNTVGILSTKGTNIKTIYCEHSNLENRTYGKKHIFRQKLGAKNATKVVTLTQRDRNNFINFFSIPEGKVICITNWLENISKSAVVYNANSNKIITVGRLEKIKGYDNLLKVANIVNKIHPEWHWDIFGEGSLHKEIEKEINRLGLNSFLTLKGNVSHIEKLYNEYSFLVMTSYFEGIPLSLLEAQNNLLPIISFDCPTGPAEIVDDNINGYIVKCYDIEEMADRIIKLIEDKKRRMEFSKKSTINIDNFNKDRILKQWEKLIEEL